MLESADPVMSLPNTFNSSNFKNSISSDNACQSFESDLHQLTLSFFKCGDFCKMLESADPVISLANTFNSSNFKNSISSDNACQSLESDLQPPALRFFKCGDFCKMLESADPVMSLPNTFNSSNCKIPS